MNPSTKGRQYQIKLGIQEVISSQEIRYPQGFNSVRIQLITYKYTLSFAKHFANEKMKK
jgi:hypothetical protein